MEGQGGAYAGCEGGREDIGPRGGRRGSDRVEGGVVDGPLAAEGDNAEPEGTNGAKVGMARAAMPHGFIPNAILLAIECERDEGSGVYVGRWARVVVQGPLPNPETDIAQAKLREAWCTEVLARPQEEEETEK